MRVLILTQHFAPEVTAGRYRIGEFANALSDRGHEVTVVCPVPNHPTGEIAAGFDRPLVRRRSGTLMVRYVWVRTSPSKRARDRLALYASYAAGSLVVGTLRPRPDLILASSPPLSVGLAGALLARSRGTPLIFDVRDPWPGAAVELGELGEGPVLSALESAERWIYRSAERVVTVNDAFARHIRGVDRAARVEVIPNGTTRDWQEAGRTDVSRAEVGLIEGEFVLTYAGNLGLAQNLDAAIEAIGMSGDGSRLVIVGAGPRRAELERLALDVGRGRVEFRDLMPAASAARLLRASDALLISERQDWTVSSKLYDYAAVGRPIIAGAIGEMARLIERRGIGIVVDPDSPEALSAALRRLRDGGADATADLVSRARSFAQEHLREEQAGRMADLVELVGR